jgi:uncharacterized Rmd1/YagE family protein
MASLYPPASVVTLVGQPYAKRETEDARLRVEWYIVLLIVFEILLTLYQLLFLGTH